MMKKTYTTTLPDHAGAFMSASETISSLGLNITRVSYNKAIDMHTLFIEVEGEEKLLDLATSQLLEKGYLQKPSPSGSIILIEFLLRDVPGSVLPVLKLINSYSFNISYISSHQDGTAFQHFRMGLFIDNSADISEFIKKASLLCELKIIDYDESDRSLDNTIFYLSFANGIAGKIGLGDSAKADLIVNSNLVMELLDDHLSSPYKTFDYIRQIAEMLHSYKGVAFVPRVSCYTAENGIKITLIEPPCGSNICVFDIDGAYLFIDSGFSCYAAEMASLLSSLFPDMGDRRLDLLLTHGDVDHCGLANMFDNVYVSKKCYDNFAAENDGRDNIRETNGLHAPYVRISKILSSYVIPDISKLRIIGGSAAPVSASIEPIGVFSCGPLDFDVYEGKGGHVSGEVVFIERKLRLVFSGDIFVNIKGFSKEQAAFNRLAPYLMTSVDTDPAEAAKEREALFSILGNGKWTVFGGHGAPKVIGI